ncbi:30S ribosomal protein S2, partial [Rhodococcus hoagii]|nr:30S ribosomal protein S2 [Prescottella equi]
WLGGMLTNFPTIQKSIRKLDIITEMQENGQINLLTKKEALMLTRQKEKLEVYFGGIRDMKKLPDMLFVVDAVKEHIAVLEARCLGIPVVSAASAVSLALESASCTSCSASSLPPSLNALPSLIAS